MTGPRAWVPDARGDAAPILEAASWLREGRRVALATVVRTWGSSPRPVGSHLAVADDGRFVGSVSAGCVEGAVIERAAEILREGQPAVLEFGISDAEAWAVGLSCGGRLDVHVAPVSEPLLTPVVEAIERKDPVVLSLPLDDVADAGRVLHPGDILKAPEDSLEGRAAAALLKDAATVFEATTGPVLLRPFSPPVRVVIVGAVHAARALSSMVAQLGWEPVVVDPRTAFARAESFPDATVRRAWPGEALAELGLDTRTAVVTLTHDPKLDDPALDAALRSPAFYVGALGSRRTHGKRVERLREAGFDETALERIHAPVGLSIGARTPEEIAVAVLAELVATRRRERAS